MNFEKASNKSPNYKPHSQDLLYILQQDKLPDGVPPVYDIEEFSSVGVLDRFQSDKFYFKTYSGKHVTLPMFSIWKHGMVNIGKALIDVLEAYSNTIDNPVLIPSSCVSVACNTLDIDKTSEMFPNLKIFSSKYIPSGTFYLTGEDYELGKCCYSGGDMGILFYGMDKVYKHVVTSDKVTDKELNDIFDGMISPYRLKAGEEDLFLDSDGNRKYLYYVHYHDGELTLVDEEVNYYKIDSSLSRRFWWKNVPKDDTKVKEFIDGFIPMFEELGLGVVLKDDPSCNLYRLNINKNGKSVCILSYLNYGNIVYLIDLYFCNGVFPFDSSFDLTLHVNQLNYKMNTMMMNTFIMLMKVKGLV
jgi:hypothetical protein